MSETNERGNWRDLYRDALLEPDPIRARPLIDKAYKVIEDRQRKLEANSAAMEETRELNIALYFLSLLRNIGSAEAEQFKARLSDASGFKMN